MDKKISIVLVAMLCISMLPWTSIGVGSEAKSVKSAETLRVDAWVESKLAKPGDTIKIYANTSYTEGVSVSADIMGYEHSEDVISSLSLENLDLSGMIYTTYVSTVSLTYDATEKHWFGIYTIPSSAGGVYVADVKATDGVNTANDNATSHLYKFYDEWLKPVQDKAETFLYGEFNDTIYYIKDQIENFRDVVNNSGGIRGIVENLTGLPEWQALLNASCDIVDDYEYYYSEYFWEYFSDNASFEYNITVPDWVDILELSGYCYSYGWKVPVVSTAEVTVTLIDPDENVYTYDLSDWEPHEISHPPAGDWTINVSTTGNGYFSLSIYGYKTEKSKIAYFLDNLTKFILSDEYENIISMIPELKSFILGIPEENIIDYLLGFNLTHYLEKIEGAEGIVATYNALMSSDEYADFQNALNALQASETHWNQQNLSIAIMNLFMSDEMMDLLNATAEYLQGNDTALQNLINSFAAVQNNFNSQLEALMDLPEFNELINAAKNDPNLGPVLESINTTFNNIKNRVETMLNSTQLKDLQASIEKIGNYATCICLCEYERFSEDKTFNYNWTVKDWVKELYLDLDPSFDGYYDYENHTWVPGTGNVTVTLTDPDGVVYTYTEEYNGSRYSYWDEGYYEYGIEEKQKPSIFGSGASHDYTILFPAPGNWTINVATFSDSGGGGNYQLQIGPTDDFVSYMLKESLEEIFFVFNAGIAIETEYFQEIGTDASAKLIAYDANGRIADEEIHIIVSRNTGGMAGASSIIPAAILYTWVSGFTTTTSGGVYAFSTGAWSGTGNSASASVISTAPTGGIKCSDITWQLVKISDGTVVAAGTIGDGTWSGTSEIGATLTVTDYLKAGCIVTVSLPESGEYKVRAIVGGSQIYESPSFTTSGSVYAKDTYYDEEYETEEVSSPFDALPYIKQMIDEINPGIVYEDKVTTDSNGEATINFPVEEFGIYTIDAYFENENRIGFGESVFIGESYVPEIGLTQIGKFAGIPVYMNPNKIGENITFNVNVPDGENASVGIAPLPLNELFPNINMSYESSDTTITGPDTVSLQVNGPVSMIGVVTGMPFGPEEKEEWEPTPYAAMSTPSYSDGYYSTQVNFISQPVVADDVKWGIYDNTGVARASGILIMDDNSTSNDISIYMYDNNADGKLSAGDMLRIWDTTGKIQAGWTFRLAYAPTGNTVCIITFTGSKSARYDGISPSSPDSFSIPHFNISFGILLTSNVSVSLDVPNILKGERSQIDVSANGTPVITYGAACYANGLDIMSLDVATLSTMAYESAVYQKEYNITEVMELMKSMICGPGNSAFVTIPKLAVDGEYAFITFTNVDNTDIGVAFTSVNVYAETVGIPAVTSSGTVDNKDVTVTYVGSGKVTIKKVTVTPQAPPANVKHIGIFIEIDTTGTVHDAFITIKYNDSDVVDIDASKLRMYYWNETISEWVLIEDSGVWTNNNTVWARISHFTIFAPMAEKTAAGPAPISWLIWAGVIGAVIIIIVISLATAKRKKKPSS